MGDAAGHGPQGAGPADGQAGQPVHIGAEDAEVSQPRAGAAGSGLREDGEGGAAEMGTAETAAHRRKISDVWGWRGE
jgi:hypothetical protein